MMTLKTLLSGLIFLLIATITLTAQPSGNKVKVVGQMRNTFWKGELYGNISLDTISNREHLYGFGPVEYLSGEILVIDGRSYTASVVTDTSMNVVETFALKAPFFAYANISGWKSCPLPDSILNLKQLEHYLDATTKSINRPYLFKLEGIVEQATIHLVNLPEGSHISSPEEAHQGQKNYQLYNSPAEIIGFFSTEHQAIFTHHDTFLHLHLITPDRQKMGHLDQLHIKKGSMVLYLPD
jgi:acetolactate decarboxylase